MANPDRLGVAAAFAFVMVVYGISNSAAPTLDRMCRQSHKLAELIDVRDVGHVQAECDLWFVHEQECAAQRC
jgi:hypothetical protein